MMKALTLVAMAAAKIPTGGTPMRRGSMNRTYGAFPPPRNHFKEVYFKDITIERGADLQIAETRKIEMRNVQINGKFVS